MVTILEPHPLRLTIHYSGRVQGVGFRYTTYRIAKDYDVFGYVQNLTDGRVRLVVEGVPEQVEAFVRHLEMAMKPYIQRRMLNRDTNIGWSNELGTHEERFRIQR